MVISGSVEGGEVTEVARCGVVGHSAGGATIPASRDDKGVAEINQTGAAINIQTQCSVDMNITITTHLTSYFSVRSDWATLPVVVTVSTLLQLLSPPMRKVVLVVGWSQAECPALSTLSLESSSSQPPDVNTSQLSTKPSPPHARPPLSEWSYLLLAMGGRVQVKPKDHSSVVLPTPLVINRPENHHRSVQLIFIERSSVDFAVANISGFWLREPVKKSDENSTFGGSDPSVRPSKSK